jgi:hypothetical protein
LLEMGAGGDPDGWEYAGSPGPKQTAALKSAIRQVRPETAFIVILTSRIDTAPAEHAESGFERREWYPNPRKGFALEAVLGYKFGLVRFRTSLCSMDPQ